MSGWWAASPEELAKRARLRAIRAAAEAAGDWDRVQLCDVANAGVSSPDGRLNIAGRRYDRDEARTALGVGGAR